MASYQDANNKRKEELKKALQMQKQMMEYQQNKENLASKGNRYRQKIGQLGKTLGKSDNPRIANIGNKMYKYSGEQGIDKAKSLNANQIKTGFNNLKSKFGFGAGATTGAGATASSVGTGAGSSALQGAIASNVAGTAGSTAGVGAGGSALTSSIASAAPAATSTVGAGALGSGAAASGAGASAGAGAAAGSSAATGAAAGASAIPVAGWIAAAAILAANAINSANNKKKMRALQVSNEAAIKGQQEALQTKVGAMQGLEQQQNQKDSIDAEQAKADAIKQQTMDEFTQLMSNNQPEHDSTPLNSISNLSDTNSSVEEKPALNDVVEPVEDNNSILSKEIMNDIQSEGVLTGGAANFVTDEKSEIPTNLPEQPIEDDKQSKIASLFGEFKKGYEENRKNGFKPENLEKTDKTISNRLGEAAGTGARVLSNPLTQGLIAGTIVGARNNDWGDGLEYGINWAQNKAKSDMYNKAITGEDVAPVIGSGLTSQDYNAHTLNDYRSAMVDNNKRKTQAQLDKTNPTMQAYADSMLHGGKWNVDKYNEFLNNPNFKPENRISLESIKTADNTAKVESDANYKGTMAGVAQQNANTNAGKLDETIRHNYATEGIAIDKNRITEAFNNVKANLKKIELNIKAQNPSGGMTAGQQITSAKTIRDAAVNMINNTDLTEEEKAALIYEANYELIKTLRNLGMSKEVISATIGVPEEQIEQVIPSGENDPLGLFEEEQQFEIINPLGI